ncbi:hypothetical protein [Acetobacter sp.]|jgi:DNA repair exonuclease SbcCD ATPase subunit|uniref:hypothetical protein n=1 Tax=Acetobacter sp. TaxID=440 RepID=UPI0025BE1C90|nr:hypothetical protein [Acetobacter sp.]MCI1301345.1 hypothetical protein [Acetobacter sp.]
MSGDFVTAGALGGIRGSLRRVANDLEQQNRTVSALAQQTQMVNHWQATAFNLQKQLAEWQAWGRKMKVGWEQEEQVSDDLRQQLEQAQDALRAEKDRGWKELNELNEEYNKLVREFNECVRRFNAIKDAPTDLAKAHARIAQLEAQLKTQKA